MTDHSIGRRLRLLVALIAVLSLIAAACGDDDAGDTTTTGATTPTTAAETTTTTAAAETTTTTAAPGTTEPALQAADFNGDGMVLIAVATVGPRDDGAYSEALVSRVEQISAQNGFETPLIVDLIDPAEGRAELENIIAQSPDIVAIGFSDLALGNEDLFLEHEEIFWYCNCGSGFQDTPGLMRSTDSGAELNISGGYAMGLMLQASGGDSVAFIGCCDLNFEVESFMAFQYGLSLVDESFTATYIPTGNFPFDFDNTAGATEAYNNAVAGGADAVYPFLGGAHEPIVQLANGDGLFVTSAGSSAACERTDLAYDMEIKFDAGDYISPIFDEILAGTATEGGNRKFTVGIDPEVGGELCNGTADQVAALQALNERIGAGEFDEKIFEILSEAYGF